MIIAHDNPVNLRGERLNEIWWQGRQWAVTSHGIEARDGTYIIAKDRLREDHAHEYPHSWIAHLSEKPWIDLDDFATAYFVAVAMHGQRLTHKEVSLLRLHLRKGREEGRLRPFYQKAREELGIGAGIGPAMSLTQLDAVCEKARELADAATPPADDGIR
jgi:hypothetical protein